jgi:SAM-dependent methyltransferase
MEVDLEEYAARWSRLEAEGVAPHGEADLVLSFAPASVLDAGCGTGRVGVELARHGVEVVGVDLDPDLLAFARQRAPTLRWECADLASLDLGRTFDLAVMAGNVVSFCRPEDRAAAVARCAAHLRPGGRLVAGFVLAEPPERTG